MLNLVFQYLFLLLQLFQLFVIKPLPTLQLLIQLINFQLVKIGRFRNDLLMFFFLIIQLDLLIIKPIHHIAEIVLLSHRLVFILLQSLVLAIHLFVEMVFLLLQLTLQQFYPIHSVVFLLSFIDILNLIFSQPCLHVRPSSRPSIHSHQRLILLLQLFHLFLQHLAVSHSVFLDRMDHVVLVLYLLLRGKELFFQVSGMHLFDFFHQDCID